MKFLADSLFRGTLTVEKKITGKNIATGAIGLEVKSLSSGGLNVYPHLTTAYGVYFQALDNAGTANIPMSFASSKFIFENGNLIVGGNTDAGYKADIVGSLRAKYILVDSASYSGNIQIEQVGNNLSRIYGGPQESITFGPDNGIRINTNLIVLNAPSTTVAGSFYWTPGQSIILSGLIPAAGGTKGLIISGNYTNSGMGGASNASGLVGGVDLATTIGAVTFNQFSIENTINTTGGTTVHRGYYYNPTISGVVGLTNIAFESTSGIVKISDLAGSGTRMVVANSSGVLSTQAIPTGTVTGTGTTNYLSKWTSSTALGNSTVFDDGNGVGIGTTTLNAQTRLTVMGSQTYSKSIVLDSTWNYQTSWAMRNGIYTTEFNLGGSTKAANEGGPGSLQVSTYNSSTNTFRYPITFFANANVAFGGTSGSVPTDNGSTVQINGSASVSNLAGTGSRMVIASSTGVLSTQAIPSATGLQTAVDTDKTNSGALAVGTTTVKQVSASTYSGVFFDYVVKNTTNVRVGSVVAITNGTTVEFYETLSNDLGDTTAISFTVDLSGGNIRLRATTTGSGWTAIVSTRGI